jgi:antitoxin (DNA-binding transcriptional repressor) of toxin-antitoxin stability system
MSSEISQRELRNDSGRIMRALTEGETFIVTRNGVPIGELTPLRRHRFVRTEAAIELFRTAAPVSFDQLSHDLDQIADQHFAPRA